VPEFLKITLEADPEFCRGFVRGWLSARGLSPTEQERLVLWPQDWDVRVSSFLGGIAEALRPGEVTVLLVDAELAAAFLAALEPWPEAMRLRAAHAIDGASFDFHYEIFDRDEAAAVQRIFTTLPDGVRVSDDYQPQSAAHTDGDGGMYAPAHRYTCRARGTLSGALRAVLDVHERCRQHERVQVEEVLLHLGPVIRGGS